MKEVLKEVLKEVDYKKMLSIVEAIDDHGEITLTEAKKPYGKSEATTWRYLKMMLDTGCVISEGNTNNAVYKRNISNLAPLARDLKK